MKTFRQIEGESIATIIGVGSDFQNQRLVRFGKPYMKVPASNHNWQISSENMIESCTYYAVRHCIKASWLNDRDQFLYPKDEWRGDDSLQSNCLTYTLFKNGIRSEFGPNHWIPFTEEEVDAREKFENNLMTQFIKGKLKPIGNGDLLGNHKTRNTSLTFSKEAQAVFDAGRELWKYYHQQPDINVNAALYDIREYFQGRNVNGRMNSSSEDETYTELIRALRERLLVLARAIQPKVYAYGFLKN